MDKYTIADDVLAIFIGITLSGAIIEFSRSRPQRDGYRDLDLERGEGPVPNINLESISISSLKARGYGAVAAANIVNKVNKLKFALAVGENAQRNAYPYFRFLSAKDLAMFATVSRKSYKTVNDFCNKMVCS